MRKMNIKKLYSSESISVRALNVCYNNGLKDLPSILQYYQVHQTFLNLRKCGKKSNNELISLCLKNIPPVNNEIAESTENENSVVPEDLNPTRIQEEIINNFIEYNLNKLSVRSSNLLTSFLGRDIKIKNFRKKILEVEKFDPENIRYVGKKTAAEINDFISLLKNFIERAATNEEENEWIRPNTNQPL